MGTAKRMRWLGLSALCSVILLGCAKETPQEPQEAELTLEPLVGIGSLEFGASKEDIVRFFGPPDQVSETNLGYIASRGLAFAMDPQQGLRTIKCWSDRIPVFFAVTTFSGTTKEGLGMGATRERIVAAYGPPDKTDAKGDVENLYYDKLKTKFTLRQGTLAAIVLDAPK